jgi:predicted Fe-Mo cluster-binding NifX family protein
MRIAVASRNFETITGHAGMARRFIVFAAEAGHSPREATRIDLPKEQTIHSANPEDRHPLDEVQVLIAGSAGDGFINRMTRRGVLTIITSETDPATAVANYLAGTLAAPAPHDRDHDEEEAGGCCCGAGSH